MIERFQVLFLLLSQSALLAGLVGAVLLPVMGIGIGITQAVRGAINTPEAIRESSRGKVWDHVILGLDHSDMQTKAL